MITRRKSRQQEKEQHRFYLLPGMGGRAYRRKQQVILRTSLAVGLFTSAVLALGIWVLQSKFSQIADSLKIAWPVIAKGLLYTLALPLAAILIYYFRSVRLHIKIKNSSVSFDFKENETQAVVRPNPSSRNPLDEGEGK